MSPHIPQTFAEVTGRHALDLRRAKQQEIADAVQQDVTGFFSPRGITVTAVGMVESGAGEIS